jgi:ribosomal protein S18 acetylase RimI-like enzyme
MPDRSDVLTTRALGPSDLDGVCDLVAQSDLATVGFVDFTPDEIAVDLAKSSIETTGWYDEHGTLVGYGWLRRIEQTNQVEVDVYVRPSYDSGLGHMMLARLEERACELAAETGHAEPWTGTGAYRQDTRTQHWLRTAGYRIDTTFTRMRIDFDPRAEDTDPPPTDVKVRRVTDEDDLRVAHEIEEGSFLEHYGNVPVSYESWLDRLTDRGEDFRHVYLAELDGTPVGLLSSSRQYQEDENAGYVRTLGVLPAGRGRGVGTALLRDYFARARREGRSAVLLHVDVANVTGALRLYESVGMRAVLEIDAWAKGERVG